MAHTAHANSPLVRNLYFASGLIATFTYRAIIILNHVSSGWATAAWYIGTVGFIVYFIHRYRVSEKRVALIRRHDLINKVTTNNALATEEKTALLYIVSSLASSKEKWNYIFIFVTSGIALVIGLVLDFILQ